MNVYNYSVAESVQHSLYNIAKYVGVMQKQLQKDIGRLDIDIIDEVFCNSMSQFDFACYVYFEYCVGQFIKQDSFRTVQEHVTDILDSDYERNGDSGWLYSAYYIRQDSLRRNICRHIQKMIENRSVYLPMVTDATAWNKLINLFEYDPGSIEKRMSGMPIGKVYIYQALTDIFARSGTKDLYTFLSNSSTSTKKLDGFYEGQFSFIGDVLLEDYKEDFSENQCKEYIAKAINLVKWEDRRKLNTMYRFAGMLSSQESKDKGHNWQSIQEKCSMGPVPPVFSDCVVLFPYLLEEVSWHNSLFPLANIYNFIRKLFPPAERAPHYPSQVLRYEKYLDYFLNANTEDFQKEELRFYIIQMLAQYYLYAIKQDCIEVSYSNKQFSYFINEYYNIFDTYRGYMNFYKNNPMTKSAASIIRKTAAEMHRSDSPKTDM